MQKNRRKNQAVSEVMGTILLLIISVSLFSVVYIATLSLEPSRPMPSSNIVGSITNTNVIFEHRSGESLSKNTKIFLNLGDSRYEINLNDYLEDANGDGLWSFGERVVVPLTDFEYIESMQTEATVVDAQSNSVIMQGVLKEGVNIDKIFVSTQPAIFSIHSSTLKMTYNFGSYTGCLYFKYKKSDGEWVETEKQCDISSFGSYSCQINVDPYTTYYFKAMLDYNSKTIEGKQLSFQTLGTIVGEWHFNSDSGTKAIDSSGNENHGWLFNKPQWTTDAIDGSHALSFDGIDDYVLVNDDDSLDIKDNISIEAWLKPLGHSDGLFGDITTQPTDVSEFGILNCLEPDFIKINNNIYAIVCRGTNNHGFLLTVEISSSGQITDKIVDTLEFDTAKCYDPNIIQIDGTNVYIIVYRGSGDDGFVRTIQINSNGQINDNIAGNSLEFDTAYCSDPNIIHIENTVYAVAYTNNNLDGCIKTIQIENSGQINSVIATSIFDENDGYSAEEFEIIHLNGINYVIAYRNKDKDGELRTVKIKNDGTITSPYHNDPKGYYIESFLFDRDDGWTPDIIHIYNNIFAVAYGGFESPYTDGWLKTIEITNDGLDFEIIDNFEFDTYFGIETNIVHVYDSIYAVAYRGTSNDGFLKTINIANDGFIADAYIDSLEFDLYDGYQPRILNVYGSVYAIAYTTSNYDGLIKTVEISNSGVINDDIIDDLELGIFDCVEPNIIHISDNVYAMVYRGLYNDGYIRTFEINNGQINDNIIDIFEFDAQNCYEPYIINVEGSSFYAVVYRGTSNHGFLKTIAITNTGIISYQNSLDFDTSCYEPQIIHVDESVYAVVYRGPGNDGFLKTFEITNTGAISYLGSLEFDTNDCYEANIINVNNNIFSIAYRNNSKGFLKNVNISSNGYEISEIVGGTLIFDDIRAYDPEIINIFNDIYAIAYCGADDDGFIKTVVISSQGQITSGIIDYLEFDTSYAYEPDIILINDRIAAISYRGTSNKEVLITLRIGENGDITDQNDYTLLLTNIEGYESNIIHVAGDIYAIACRFSNYDGYVITTEIKETQKVRRVIEKQGAYKIYANSNTVFAYINDIELTAPISQGYNYIVLTYYKNGGIDNMKLYVNATEIINCTYSQDISTNANNLYFGGFNGIIDEIIIHEKELSKDEITQRYNDFTS